MGLKHIVQFWRNTNYLAVKQRSIKTHTTRTNIRQKPEKKHYQLHKLLVKQYVKYNFHEKIQSNDKSRVQRTSYQVIKMHLGTNCSFVQKYGHILMSQANISTLSNDKSLHIIINAILCSEIETFKFKTFVDKINKE